MGLLVKGAQITENALGKTAGVGKAIAKKHPKATKVAVVGAGGYTLGAVHSSSVQRQHPEFYDKTPNNGRSEDKHPGSYYGQ